MAITKVSRGLLSTGVSDSSDATAITIDSSENVTFAGGLVIPSTITHVGDTDTKLDFNQANTLRLITGDNTAWVCNASSMVINEDSIDFDFRVESNNNANMLFVDGGNDRVGIGTSSPARKVQIQDTSASVYLAVTSANNNAAGIMFGDTDDETMGRVTYDNTNNSMQFWTNDSQKMLIDSSGSLLVNRTSKVASEKLSVKGEIRAGYTGSDQQVYLGVDGANAYLGTSESGFALKFEAGGSERMRINSSGHLVISDSGRITQGSNVGTSSGTGGYELIQDSNAVRMNWYNDAGATRTVQYFYYEGTERGSIQVLAGSTSYLTSSDYRLKENVDYTWDATTRLKQLKPARFNFTNDTGNTVDGFLAHEVSSLVPDAISGTKDEVDSEGNPKYQGIDHSKLVPLLVKTIQELEARITTLEG